MSPFTGTLEELVRGVPRASGDEPMPRSFSRLFDRCSPRERG